MKNLILTAAAVSATSAMLLSSPVSAQSMTAGDDHIRRWNMCDWHRIPENVLRRIAQRNDYDDILRRMFDSCPEAALSLTDQPTATISDGIGIGDDTGRENDNGRPETESPTPRSEPAEPAEPAGPVLPG
jgi:hypothetical protein